MSKITPKQYDQFVGVYQRVKKKVIELSQEKLKKKKVFRTVELQSIDVEEDGWITVIYFEPSRYGGGVYGEEHYFYFDKDWICDLI